MAKRGRKPQPTYITMWTEAVEGVRQVVIERDSKGMPTEWRLYPTGLGKPYFGTIRPGDVESERKAIAKFERWKATQDGKPWDKEVGEEPLHDTIWVSMFDPRLRDRRTEHLIKTYISRYRKFIRNLILSDCRKAALELDIEQLAWFEQLKAPKPSLPLKEVGEMYFNRTQEMSAHWKRKSERMWKEFIKCIGVKKVADITPESISQYHDLVYSRFQEGKSPTYVAHRFGSVKAVLSFALTRGKDQEQLKRVLTLCKMLSPPKKRGVNPQPIQPEHFRKMLESVEDQPKWKAVFLLALNGAFYPSDIAAMNKTDVNLDEGTVVMDRGKTGVLRVAVLWQRTVDAIREYQRAKPHHSEYLFVSRTGAQFSDNHITRNFNRRRGAAGIPKGVQFAHIRDGAFTAAYNADGVEEKHARVLAGHRSGMSDHYVRRNPRVVATASEAIERYYFGDVATDAAEGGEG